MLQNIFSDSQTSITSFIHPSSSVSNIFDNNIDPSLYESNFTTTNLSSTPSYPPGLRILSQRNGGNKCAAFPSDTENKYTFDQEVAAFLDWWQDTDSARKMQQKGKKMIWGGGLKRSSAWKYFIEVATFPQGDPKVRCIHCYTLLEHPIPQRGGTKTMTTHTETAKCGLDKKGKGVLRNKRSIKNFLENGTVCIP
jgi:hypothetical protein